MAEQTKAENEKLQKIMRRQSDMETRRSNFDQLWHEIAERVFPRQDDFFTGKRSPGTKRTQKMFDSTAPRALPKFASVMESLLTPRNQIWSKLKVTGQEVSEGPAAEWLDEVNQRLFQIRYGAQSNFPHAVYEGYMSLGAFGTQALFMGKGKTSPIMYRICHMSEIYIAENFEGRIDTVHRKFYQTARQVSQMFPADRLPEKFLERAEMRPDEDVIVLHCTYPNDDPVYGREDAKGMPFTSVYALPEYSCIVEEGGYTSWPWAISRYVKAPGEIYGSSPAREALADILSANEAQMARLGRWHQLIKPVLLLADDGMLGALKMRPGSANPGRLDAQGRELVKPFPYAGDPGVDAQMMDSISKAIEDPFLVTLFLAAIQNPNMTATQVLEIVKQQGILIAPQAGRQQSEFLNPIIAREFDLAMRAGLLPPPPEELANGGEYEVEYVSPLATAARADQALTLIRGYQQVELVAQTKPAILDNIDEDELYKEIAWANAFKAKVSRTPDEVAQIRDQRAQQQAAEAAVQAGPMVGKTALDLSKAQQAAA
jgi:hypothetical protein